MHFLPKETQNSLQTMVFNRIVKLHPNYMKICQKPMIYMVLMTWKKKKWFKNGKYKYIEF